jgi:RecB family exonuclease
VLREAPPANLEDVVAMAVDEAASTHERRQPVGHPLLWKLGKQRIVRELTAMIRSQRAKPFARLLPERAEWKFEVELPGVGHLGGRIDRVDVGEGRAGVIDYKTRKVETRKDRAEGLLKTEWQLPIYAYAVRAAGLGASVDGALVSTRHGQKTLAELAKGAGVTVDELLATDEITQARLAREGKPNLGTEVAKLVGQLRAGDFAARPIDCQYCPYRAVCRISARKLPEDFGR